MGMATKSKTELKTFCSIARPNGISINEIWQVECEMQYRLQKTIFDFWVFIKTDLILQNKYSLLENILNTICNKNILEIAILSIL